MRAAPHNVAQFTGSYLNRSWTRRFILSTLLQRYDSSRLSPAPVPAGGATEARTSRQTFSETSVLLQQQRQLSEAWGLSVRPLDVLSEKRIFRLLARYCVGEGQLSDEALEELNMALSKVPGAPRDVSAPAQMLQLLQAVDYVQQGDNIHRIAFQGPLHYPPQAHSLMEPFLSDALTRDGGDAFDSIRVHRPGPGYAIDSITTSEVDDAIGVEYDDQTGEPFFTVYVSDATVYCPYDSPLEQVTARELTTTTYLPEGVFFMLPKPIVAAATLREDRPCRTFNIRFQVDCDTGDVKAYSVEVGWLHTLRRITYDQAQVLLVPPPTTADDAGRDSLAEHERPPPWLTTDDARKLKTIYDIARVRLAARQARERGNSPGSSVAVGAESAAAENTNLPDPLVKVDGKTVLSVEDQIVCTQDARLAVAELMIAANEVCSRVAQANGLSIPFRGTRPLSSEHDVARYAAHAQGVAVLPSLDRTHLFVAEAISATIQRLSGVTRAIYSHIPLYHAGLETSHYAHSTSPLRRYADMLVHHQLKVWLREQAGSLNDTASRRRGRARVTHEVRPGVILSLDAQQLIPEFTMAALCAKISTQQEQTSLLQDNSTRFWILRYVQDQIAKRHKCQPAQPFSLVALVGTTRDVHASPEYARHMTDAATRTAALAHRHADPSRHTLRAAQRYVSDIYIPSLQMTHVLVHDEPRVVVGAVVTCRVLRVLPEQGVLELAVEKVEVHKDERQLERLWSGAVIASLDA